MTSGLYGSLLQYPSTGSKSLRRVWVNFRLFCSKLALHCCVPCHVFRYSPASICNFLSSTIAEADVELKSGATSGFILSFSNRCQYSLGELIKFAEDTERGSSTVNYHSSSSARGGVVQTDVEHQGFSSSTRIIIHGIPSTVRATRCAPTA